MTPPAPRPIPGGPVFALCAECGERVAVTFGFRATWRRREAVVPLCPGCRCFWPLEKIEPLEVPAASYTVLRGGDGVWREYQGIPWEEMRSGASYSAGHLQFSRFEILASWGRGAGILTPRVFCTWVQNLPDFA